MTPFGVVYDNGMELKQLYAGYRFPAYFYGDCPLVMCAASQQSGERAYLELPASDRQIGRSLLRAGTANLREAVVCAAQPDHASEVRRLAEGGLFTSRGYVAYQGTVPLPELMQDDPAEQYQREQQMGGMS